MVQAALLQTMLKMHSNNRGRTNRTETVLCETQDLPARECRKGGKDLARPRNSTASRLTCRQSAL